MATRKLKSNEDLVRDLMNYSPHGGLCQAFIVTAIQKYARLCIEAGPEKFNSGLMNGQTWVGIAKDIDQRIDAFFASSIR